MYVCIYLSIYIYIYIYIFIYICIYIYISFVFNKSQRPENTWVFCCPCALQREFVTSLWRART